MSKISNEFHQAIIKEMEKMKRDLEEKQGLPDEYIELHKIIKLRTARVTKEQTEMANIFKAFVKKHQAGGRTVLIKTLEFYLDSLKQFDYQKIL